VAKLLRHRRHGSGHAYGLDVRSHNLDRADTNIVTQEPCCGLHHVQRLPFWRRAPGRWDSERTLAGALACWPAAWSCGSSGGDLHALWLARHRLDYQPVLSDWLWNTVLPLVSYAALVVAAIVLPSQPVPALFVIGAVTMLLLFIGIHNAWDVVTYTAFERSQPQDNMFGK
jgi:hypothetical protein